MNRRRPELGDKERRNVIMRQFKEGFISPKAMLFVSLSIVAKAHSVFMMLYGNNRRGKSNRERVRSFPFQLFLLKRMGNPALW